MTISIARNDCTIEELHRLAGMCKDVRQSRRFRALAMVLDGVCRSEVAAAQGTTVQSIRDWILRFNAHEPDGLADDGCNFRRAYWESCVSKELASVICFATTGFVSRFRPCVRNRWVFRLGGMLGRERSTQHVVYG